jgi:hypothetical protein
MPALPPSDGTRVGRYILCLYGAGSQTELVTGITPQETKPGVPTSFNLTGALDEVSVAFAQNVWSLFFCSLM